MLTSSNGGERKPCVYWPNSDSASRSRRAMPGVAAKIREQGLTVSAFYVSNVEQYLFEPGVWPKWAQASSAVNTRIGASHTVTQRKICSTVASAASRRFDDGITVAVDSKDPDLARATIAALQTSPVPLD